jgi:hypothetical protein
MSTLLFVFLIFHLYQFDRFKCLKWNSGPYSGAFKRIMTYSYFVTIPLIMAYAYGYTYIKYTEGYFPIPGLGVIPKPSILWRPEFQSAMLPLQLIFSIGWALEMVTHLEELCFWLFLVNAGHAQQDWFHSAYFKTWLGGSVIALVYMPLVVVFTRNDAIRMEAYTFLAGSLGSLSLTLWFLPILWTFPSFLKNLKSEGVDTQTLVRLTKFHELNTIRVAFRFMFTIPFVVLGVDGIRAAPRINLIPFMVDFGTSIAAVGCIVSSGITLIIFFPRNIETEINTKEAQKLSRSGRQHSHVQTYQSGAIPFASSQVQSRAHMHTPSQRVLLETRSYDDDVKSGVGSYAYSDYAMTPATQLSRGLPNPMTAPPSRMGEAMILPAPVTYKPNRRLTDEEGGGVELGTVRLTEDALDSHNMRMSRSHILNNYTSPLDLAYTSGRGR